MVIDLASSLRGQLKAQRFRLSGLADAFDAMATDRPYKAALPLEECEAVLRKTAGKMYDPELVEVFVKHHLGALYLDQIEAPAAGQ